MDIFASCSKINDLLNLKRDNEARNVLIKLLAHHESNNINYTPLVNHLIRSAGLYPYIQQETADWQDRFVHEAFKVDTGATEPLTLHREQSILLKARRLQELSATRLLN